MLFVGILLIGVFIWLISVFFKVQFVYPWVIFLWLVVSLLLAFVLLKLYEKNSIYFKFVDDILKVFKFSSLLFYAKILLFSTIVILIFFVFAKPVKVSKEELKKNWIDIVISLDISPSMEAQDLYPNRLKAAKNIIEDFVKWLENDRVWLVVFAWKPLISLPLTFDYDIVKEILKNISTKSVNSPAFEWTAIWDALLLAKNLFKDKKRTKIIILLTDWDANKWVNPILAAEYLKKFGIKVYTIGIWSKQWWYITQQVWPFIQKIPIPPLKEDTLRQIAQITNGKFYRATDNQTLKKIFKDISKLTKTQLKEKKYNANEDVSYFYVFSIIVLLSLFLLFKTNEV